MSAGKLFERVTFSEPRSDPDGYGGTVDGWAPRLTTYAHFRYLRGGETVQAARLRGRQPVVATIRDQALAREIAPDWRMVDEKRGTVFNVRAIVPSENRLYLEITAESGVEV